AYNGRYYGVPQGWPVPDFASLEVAPPPEVAIGLTETGAATWIERITGELRQPLGLSDAPPGHLHDLRPREATAARVDEALADDGSPRLIRTVGTTDIFRSSGRYYAVP